MKPITPDEVGASKTDTLPPEVIETWNRLIATNFTAGLAVIKQDEAVEALQHRMFCQRQHIYDSHWLDIEEAYRAAGWDVCYEKPGYNESGEAFFEFRRATS